MRLLALALTTALALPGLASAQTLPALPALDETAQQRSVRRAAMIPPVLQEDAALQAAIGSDTRPAADVARDVYRRPFEALTFWGLTPGSTVVEIQPGRAGWWTAILQPYAEATDGRYVAVNQPLESMVVEDGTADMVLVARAFHNWHRAGRTEAFLAAFFKALKPGGVLAVEQHRSVDGLNPDVTAPTGYMPESHIIHAAQAAGFVLDARNPNDRQTPLTEAERAEYDAIGESDRMTLRFRKPG